MKLSNFNDRDQNNIVQLAMKIRNNVIEYQGEVVHLPNSINALFVCVNKNCNETQDVTYYLADVMNNNVAGRIACIVCGGSMSRKFIGVNITQVLNRHMKHAEDYSNKNLISTWLSDLELE